MDFLGGLTISGGVSIVPPAGPPAATYSLYSWGYNRNGELGLNNTIYRSSPTQVGTTDEWIAGPGGIGVKSNGTLWTWDLNDSGQLGINTQNGSDPFEGGARFSSPIQVGSGTDWAYPYSSNGAGNNGAIKSNGTLWIWGNNGFGTLGLNDIIARSSPVQVGAGTDWDSLSIAGFGVFAIKDNNTLWAWGDNYGFLGLNDTVRRSSPTQVGTDTNWKQVSAAGPSFFGDPGVSAFIKTDGTLWVCGKNSDFGPLGLNDRINRSSPVQVGNATDWDKVSVDNEYMLAIKTNGTLWGWGRNQNQQLGISNTVDRSSPIQIGSSTDWSDTTAGAGSFAIKTNGTLWAWGTNNYGALGLGVLGNRSSPTQVGTDTDWQKVWSYSLGSFGIRGTS